MKIFVALASYLFLTQGCFGLTVLIDPGHGGEDHGAEGIYRISKKRRKKVKEKDIALSLAKKIKKRLNGKHSVFLTRTIDRTVTLAERAELAEKIKADIFISVHVNSSNRKNPRGFETYYLDNHKDGAVRKVEAIENKNLKGEELVINKILTDLVIDQTVHSSKKLAASIHGKLYKSIGKKFKMVNRGIKPGLFYVLALAKRPAVLLEVGFLSNPNDLRKLLSKKFQDRYAKAVADGINLYVKKNLGSRPHLF
jgi:N-acetylmuramoyl-L-alanine amidase